MLSCVIYLFSSTLSKKKKKEELFLHEGVKLHLVRAVPRLESFRRRG